jgi:CO/xanthine dehydrogenase FAD-binding subunit
MSLKFIQPESLTETTEALAQYGDEAKIIAGGTAVVLMMQEKLIAPEVLVSLARVPGLDYMRADDVGLHLGPLTRLRDICRRGSNSTVRLWPRPVVKSAMYVSKTRPRWAVTWLKPITLLTPRRCCWPWMPR